MRRPSHGLRRFSRNTTVLLLLLLTLPLGVFSGSSAQDASPVATPVSDLPWWQDAVCYEIFVRSFADSDGDGIGDLRGIIDRLDYLNDGEPGSHDDLGVNCIWLTPVTESPSYHGYDTVDYDSIEQDYGTNADFQALIAAANQRGIRILIDLVLNHVSVEHPWFQEALADPASPFRDYFVLSETDPEYQGSFGQQVWFPTPTGEAYYYATFGAGLPDLNYRKSEVTANAKEVARYWVEEMGVSGFRLDAIKHLIEQGAEQESTEETHAWLRDFGAYLTALDPEIYTVGEIFGASAFILSSYFPDQLTAYFQFEISVQIIQAVLAQSAGSLVYTVQDALDQLPDQRFAPFLTNHDQVRTMSLLSGNTERAKLAATTLFTLPGLPFVYYGEEIGMTGNKPDPRLRTPMQWTADPSGFTTGTPWEPFQDDVGTINVADQTDDPDALLNHYRALIDLHLSLPALSHGETIMLDAPSPVAAFIRQSEAQTILVVINFDEEAVATPELSGAIAELSPGDFELSPLLGSAAAETLTVTAEGEIEDYTGITELAPVTGYVFELTASS
jgi:alpha-amylase